MVQLLMVIMAIGLSAAALTATISYLPTWTATAEKTYTLSKAGFVTLEAAFKGYSAANGGAAPVPSAAQDGGIGAFQAYYSFLPKAPAGFAWKYGFNGTDYYFCVYPTGTGGAVGDFRGLDRLRQVFSEQQFFVNPDGITGCGGTVSIAEPVEFPAQFAGTYLVKYVPGMP